MSDPAQGRDGVATGDTGVAVRAVGADELEAVAGALAASPTARLADLFGTPGEGDEVVLRLVYGLDAEHAYLIIESPVAGGRYAAVSEVSPAAFVEECEAYEQYGIRPATDEPLDRVLIPPGLELAFPRLGGSASHNGDGLRTSHLVRGEAFEFPFGPVRASGWESLYTGLVTTGEEVLDLYLFYWHKHRGIERRLVGRTPADAVFGVERVEGLSAVANTWAFCSAVETVSDAEVPPRGHCARAIALELERIYNHLAAVAALCQATGLSVGQAQAEMLLERALRCNLGAFGHRYLFGVVDLGGVRRLPDPEALGTLLPAISADFDRLIGQLMATNSFVDRLEAAGIVTGERAALLGLVGPVARGSGCSLDVRREHPIPPWDWCQPAVPTREGGDVYARMQVMVAEVAESRRIVAELCSRLGPVSGGESVAEASRVRVRPGPGSSLGWAESSRGESLAWVALDEAGRITRVRLRPAAVRNWRAFDDAVRSRNVFTDVPIIEASFWLTVAGAAR